MSLVKTKAQIQRLQFARKSLDTACNCGQTHDASFFCDARATTQSDPTGTLSIRKSLAREFESRWRKVKLAVNKVIRDDDSFALSSASVMAAQVISTEGGRLKAFQTWLDATLNMIVLGNDAGRWLTSSIARGYNLGTQRANRLLGTRDAWDPAKHPRHPAGSSQGGEFAESGTGAGEGEWKGTGDELERAALKNNKLTPDEEKAVNEYVDYTGQTFDFAEVNRKLRGYLGLDEDEAKGVKDLQSAINKASLPRDMIVHRGIVIGKDDAGEVFGDKLIKKLENMKLREHFVDPGFMSTSLGSGVASDFGPLEGDREGAMLKIYAKKGDKALPTQSGREAEVIFQRGTRLLYLGKVKNTYILRTAGVARIERDSFFDNLDRITLLTNAAAIEVQGVMEAVSQQAARAFNAAMLSNSAPREAANVINKIIDDVGILRSKAVASVSIVHAHATGTLDTFQAKGINRVGIEPERHRIDGLTTDARKKKPPTASQQRTFLRRERKLSTLGRVNVETAGDSKVCPICEDIADEGPYTIDAARGLIPAHPSCRCAFTPAEED